MLMERASASDPRQRALTLASDVGKIGVLATVTSVTLTESAETTPLRGRGGERKRPEQIVVVAVVEQLSWRRTGPVRVRIGQVVQAPKVVAAGRGWWEIGNRAAQKILRHDASGTLVRCNQLSGGHAIHVEKHQKIGAGIDGNVSADIPGEGQRKARSISVDCDDIIWQLLAASHGS